MDLPSNMDFYSLAVSFTRLKMYPVFECVHYILMCMNVKEDIQKSVAFPFAKQHPLASWVASMLLCFASQIWFCFLFNKPLADVFTNPEKIAMASAVWYLVNYVPADVVYNLLSFKPIKVIVVGMKEVHRVYGIYAGVISTAKSHPGQYLLQVVAGIVKGAAAELMMFNSRLSAGLWRPNEHQYLRPNTVFKASCVISVVFVLEKASVFSVDHVILFSVVIITLIYVRLSQLILGMRDPFVPFENLFCSLVFGGMWDALKRATSQESLSANSSSDGKVKKS